MTDSVEGPDDNTAEDFCPRCDGSGEVGGETCPQCGGSGRIDEPVGG
jgi:DnaJ-class molecular chaperone